MLFQALLPALAFATAVNAQAAAYQQCEDANGSFYGLGSADSCIQVGEQAGKVRPLA
jgi:hypothetical protein